MSWIIPKTATIRHLAVASRMICRQQLYSWITEIAEVQQESDVGEGFFAHVCFMSATKMVLLVHVCFHLLACCIHMAVSCLRKCMHTATKMTFKVRNCHDCVLADVDYAGHAVRSATFFWFSLMLRYKCGCDGRHVQGNMVSNTAGRAAPSASARGQINTACLILVSLVSAQPCHAMVKCIVMRRFFVLVSWKNNDPLCLG